MPGQGKIITMRGRTRNGTSVSLETFINRCRTDSDKVKPVSAYALVHHPSGKEIHSVTLGGQGGKTDSEMADMFFNMATSYAEGISGIQNFELLAFFGGETPEAYQPFAVSGRTEFDGLSTEGPDKAGALAQGMRLTEMMVQGCFRQLSSMHEQSRHMMQDMQSDNRELRTENREMFGILKNLLVEREQREHDRALEEMRFQRASEERAMWMRMAPPLINNILGKEIFPQNTADTALIETIVDHITDDQIQILSTVLPPTLWGPLSSRMSQIIAEKEKNKLRLKELAQSAEPVVPTDDHIGEM